MAFFCGHQWKSLLQIKAHLVAKNTPGAGAGAVAFIISGFNDMSKKIQVLLHGCKLISLTRMKNNEEKMCIVDLNWQLTIQLLQIDHGTL